MSRIQDQVDIKKAERLLAAGDVGKAEAIAKKIAKKQPRSVSALRLLGRAAGTRRHNAEAVRYYEKALQLAPRDHTLHAEIARVHKLAGAYDKALESYDRALGMRPGDPTTITAKADLLDRRGDLDAALALLEPSVRAGTETERMALVYGRALLQQGDPTGALAALKRHLEGAESGGDAVRPLWIQAAHAYERLDRYDDAFDALRKGNAWGPSRFSRETREQRVDDLIRIFSRDDLARMPRSSNTTELPVFIAAMPRSGSTLVEQIIQAHPRAHGEGEMPHFHRLVRGLHERVRAMSPYPHCLEDVKAGDLDRLAREHQSDLRKLHRSADRIVNKHLDLPFELGLVQLALPKARVVHIQRDRMDTGLACYRAMFNPASVTWSTDLESIGVVQLAFDRLMDHWLEVLDLPIHTVVYEDLVHDPEQQIRALIEFIGLEWDDRCLRFYEADRDVATISYSQVRQPMNTSSIGRWKKYEQHLTPLRAALGLE